MFSFLPEILSNNLAQKTNSPSRLLIFLANYIFSLPQRRKGRKGFSVCFFGDLFAFLACFDLPVELYFFFTAEAQRFFLASG